MTQPMLPPMTITVGPVPFAVWYNVDKVVSMTEDGTAWGACDTTTAVIAIREDLPTDMEAVVLLHETLHAVMAQNGLAHDLGEDAEEWVADRLSFALVKLLRDNPVLVKFITREG